MLVKFCNFGRSGRNLRPFGMPVSYALIQENLPARLESAAPAKIDTFHQQTDLMIETRRLKPAEEISWLHTFLSGKFC
jgi:hypothetical protein